MKRQVKFEMAGNDNVATIACLSVNADDAINRTRKIMFFMLHATYLNHEELAKKILIT